MALKQGFIVVLIIISMILVNPSYAAISNSALSGWGTNATQNITQYAPLSYIDSASQRFSWASVEPQQGQYNFSGVDSFIDPLIAEGKKVAVGIMWKGRYIGPTQNNGCGTANTSSCIDGTPVWVLSSSYDPVSSTTDSHPMLNYLNPNVQNAMRQTTAALVDHIKTKYADNPNISFLICSGIDCEAQPEDSDSNGNRTDQAYINKWGGNNSVAVSAWITFIQFLVNMADNEINAQYPNKTRYLAISANFKDGITEKNAYANIIQGKPNTWGLYTAGISTGYDGPRYSQPHSTTADEILSNNGDIQDILRKFCLTRPCLGEHGDAGSQDSEEWKHWWRAASALWQRVDGFMTRGPWIPLSQKARQFFNTYATKTALTTPRAWVALHEDYTPQSSNLRQRNFTFYLDQFEGVNIDGKTSTTSSLWSGFNSTALIGGDYRGAFARSTYPGRVMAFRAIADNNSNYYITGGPHNVIITITYYDQSSNTISLYYNSPNGIKQAWIVTKTNTARWIDKTVNLADALFNKGINGADFYIDDNNDGDEVLHWASVEKITQIPPW
ncbi:beta-galactosidase [Candidatus Gottesmanbacteria bacterium]|nr:beta-galactosidase [Candidatus Gottesmanbacteria bacterium]